MASRIIHLAITDCILKSYKYKNKNRMELGSILPDAATSGNSHMKIDIVNGKKTYNLTGFRYKFFPKMMEDDLYLGYYLHLVQDAYFRDFVYNRYHWNPFPPGNVDRLHNDYILMNQYVIQKYSLSDTITVPAKFDVEPLNELGIFAIQQFLIDMKTDFQSCPAGTSFFFTRKMADEFIAYASKKCEEEIESLYNGLSCVDEKTLAWSHQLC